MRHVESAEVTAYLKTLREELADLPRETREEVYTEVSSHIVQAVANLPEVSPVGVLTVLDSLGTPEEIANAAREPSSPRVVTSARRPGVREVGALVLLPLLWPVGVVLLWTSSLWHVRDKVIGSIFVPGGFLGSFVIAGLILGNRTCVNGVLDASGHVTGLTCSPSNIEEAFRIIFSGLELLAPIVAVVYLGVVLWLRLRRQNVSAG